VLGVAGAFSINTKVIFEDVTAIMFSEVAIQFSHIHMAFSGLTFATLK
jgi:hypothetical protein